MCKSSGTIYIKKNINKNAFSNIDLWRKERMSANFNSIRWRIWDAFTLVAQLECFNIEF